MGKSIPHIYIVDDDLSFGKSLKRLLNARGISVDIFLSAQSFLDSVPCSQTNGFAIVDIHMPDCDGFALMDKMNELGYAIPVIIITGKQKEHMQSRALRQGAIGFLKKPFSEKSLVDLIESYTEESILKV